MPPKRQPAAGRVRPSKLAREHKITAEEEAEIQEAFSLFAEEDPGTGESMMPTADLGRALEAELKEFRSILDPDGEGAIPYEPFVAICAAQMHRRDDDDAARDVEREAAFRLFANGGGGGPSAADAEPEPDRITLAHLKRVAALLKMDVPDDMLRDMILEANGGAGVARGVSKAEFLAVMRL